MTDRSTVLFVLPDSAASAETEAAFAWLGSQADFEARALPLADLAGSLPAQPVTVWFHWPEPPLLSEADRSALDAHIGAGGGLLATLAAVTLPAQLGWETVPPNMTAEAAWSDEPDDIAFAQSFSVLTRVRGLQSFRGHPLFEMLPGGGVYTWDPEEGETFVRYGYTGDSWPKQARVIAVQKSYVAMSADRRLAWEYMIGDGWSLCIGAYVYFAAQAKTHRPHLEQLVRNALRRTAPNGSRARALGGEWRPPAVGIRFQRGVPLPPALPANAGAAFEPDADVRLERAVTDEAYTLAGARALLVGRERTGPEELWFHPVRAMSRWGLEVADAESDREVLADHFAVAPGVVVRRLSIGGGSIEERTTVAPDEPGVLIELQPLDSSQTLELTWKLESDLRLMWPYPAWSTGRFSYAVQPGAVGVQAETGEWFGVRIEPAPAVLSVADGSDSERSRLRLRAELELDGPVRILLLGSGRGERVPDFVDPTAWAERRRADRRAQRELQFTLRSGEPELDEGVEWAKWRLSTYRVYVPELGTALVGGYDSSRRGVFFDGRPGYAWFFGRDAVWTALGCLAVGQHKVIREVLEFLGRHQDITGKILHECTTSGVVHYDSADSTPLYLLLAARYLHATGDEETLRREWPRVLKAYDYCLSTDSDGDGLIENSGVGHGWVEFGPFGGHHVSLYLAGIWVAALQELEEAARRLDEHEFADEVGFRAGAARSSLELSLYDPVRGCYANGRWADGSLDLSETVMIAVPLLLGAVRPGRCQNWLNRVATDDFTAPWGVRMVSRSQRDYRPDGYHTGSAWPLFSGWVSLAEYKAGRKESAERHWRQNIRLYRDYALGAWPEVLHGEQPRRIGVTPDQAWSTAMAVLPLIMQDGDNWGAPLPGNSPPR